MPRPNIMLIAGEASGDKLAAELVRALRQECGSPGAGESAGPGGIQFFGAGGEEMVSAGVALAFDMTRHAVVGLIEVLKNYRGFKRIFDQLLQLAITRRPDVIVCVDFSGFNRRFAAAVRRHQRQHPDPGWQPKIVQYVSPQVWASRPGRAEKMARDIDLLLAIFPFEKDWYAARTPGLRVEFVGHPIIDRYSATGFPVGTPSDRAGEPVSALPVVLLLPGSRVGELKRHLPVMAGALKLIRATFPEVRSRLVLPNESLAALARSFPLPAGVEIQIGKLDEALAGTTVAIASTGTVTMECARFGIPTVAIYKTSWSTYQIGRRIIQVRHLAMPNLLAGRAVFPEFIQNAATAENISKAALELLRDKCKRAGIQSELRKVISSLGEPGASARAARAILRLLKRPA
jgi:lipid-A-disaccharide synthase